MEDIELLTHCLSRATPVEKIAALRMSLFTEVTAWERLFAVASDLRMMPVLATHLRDRVLLPPTVGLSDPGQLSPTAILTAQWDHHERNRKRQETALEEIVWIISRLGPEPILLKGARSLWSGTDVWRTMRDLDVLVPAQLARDAHQALTAAGFASREPSISSQNHLAALFRPDLPGWLEIHHTASGHYAEPFLPTGEIVERSLRHEKAGRYARIMTLADHIWHGLIHHHFGHRGFRAGSIDMKGLFEFSDGIASLPQTGFEALSRLAHRNGAGLAAFELWVAAAVDLFGAPLPTGARVIPDARATWERMKSRMRRGKSARWYLSYLETVTLALASDRIRRASGRVNSASITRWRAIERLFPR